METTDRLWDSQLYVSTYIECKVCRAKSKEVWNTQYNDKPNEREKEVIDSWNTRKPMQEIVERLEEERMRYYTTSNSDQCVAYGIKQAIMVVKEVGGMNG